MSDVLPQIIVDAKTAGWYDWIVEPDGRLHPNTEDALLNGYYFDVAAAERVMQFYVTLLRIPWVRGEPINEWERFWIDRYIPGFNFEKQTPTKPFVLMQWWFYRVLAQLFGWKQSDGRRRYRKGFITTAKKSGKSSTLAGLPLYMVLGDGEEEAEVYATAVDRDQAGIIFTKTDKMVRQSPDLEAILHRTPSTWRIAHDVSGSYFQALASDADSSEGKNPHLLIADEVHAWRDRKFFESLMYGDISRSQPLFLQITTAGNDEMCVGFEEYKFACELLDPNNEFFSPSHFAFIAEAGRNPLTGEVVDYEWDDPQSWDWANPSICEGVGSLETLKPKCDEAKRSPAKKRSFVRYICNRWVAESDDVMINRDYYRECGSSELEIDLGEKIWLGLDLASVEDLVALASCWWVDEKRVGLKVRFWMPEEGIKDKVERWKAPLFDWIEQGWIETTPGRTVDYRVLREAISGVHLDEAGEPSKKRLPSAISQQFDLQELAYDRALATNLVVQQLGEYDGLPIAEHGQGFMGIGVPAKNFIKLIADKLILHDNNPVMDWQVGHCVADRDAADNIKPNKRKSRQKIDGIVAAIMAVGRATLAPPAKQSVYERREVLTF